MTESLWKQLNIVLQLYILTTKNIYYLVISKSCFRARVTIQPFYLSSRSLTPLLIHSLLFTFLITMDLDISVLYVFFDRLGWVWCLVTLKPGKGLLSPWSCLKGLLSPWSCLEAFQRCARWNYQPGDMFWIIWHVCKMSKISVVGRIFPGNLEWIRIKFSCTATATFTKYAEMCGIF